MKVSMKYLLSAFSLCAMMFTTSCDDGTLELQEKVNKLEHRILSDQALEKYRQNEKEIQAKLDILKISAENAQSYLEISCEQLGLDLK